MLLVGGSVVRGGGAGCLSAGTMGGARGGTLDTEGAPTATAQLMGAGRVASI